MSPRRNWDSPNPSLASECAPPPRTKGGGAHSPVGEGLGEFQFRRSCVLHPKYTCPLLCINVLLLHRQICTRHVAVLGVRKLYEASLQKGNRNIAYYKSVYDISSIKESPGSLPILYILQWQNCTRHVSVLSVRKLVSGLTSGKQM